MKLVEPDYVYDSTAAIPTEKDQQLASVIHAVVQEVRKQMSADDESPGQLTAQEILTIAFQHVPAAASVIVQAVKDGLDALDVESIGHCLVHNLVDDDV